MKTCFNGFFSFFSFVSMFGFAFVVLFLVISFRVNIQPLASSLANHCLSFNVIWTEHQHSTPTEEKKNIYYTQWTLNVVKVLLVSSVSNWIVFFSVCSLFIRKFFRINTRNGLLVIFPFFFAFINFMTLVVQCA